MRLNNFYTKLIFISIFTVLSQNIVFGQCPQSAGSAGNETIVTVDSGIIPVIVSPGLPPEIQIFQQCSSVVNNAALTIDVTYQGATTTFDRQTTTGVSGTGSCQVKYDNPTADEEITTPFTINFSDNPTENCNYLQSGALPVEISKFDVKVVDNEVVLEWETVEELNNDYFEILRSNNAKDWEIIGFVSGAGTTLQTVRYNFVDDAASLGNNYYVLVQTDYDGSIQFSEMQVISLKGARTHISLYPNPASQNLTVEVSEDANFPLDVNIFDATGRLVAVHQLLDYNQTLNIDELDKGFYQLQVNSPNASISERFIKQ